MAGAAPLLAAVPVNMAIAKHSCAIAYSTDITHGRRGLARDRCGQWESVGADPGSAPRSGRLSGAHRPALFVGCGRPGRRMLDECNHAARHESCGPHRCTRPGHFADLDETTASRDLDAAPGASRGHLECPRISSGVDDDLDPITLHISTMRPSCRLPLEVNFPPCAARTACADRRSRAWQHQRPCAFWSSESRRQR